MSITNQAVVYFSNDWKADNRTSSHHIVRHLAKHNKVLYVESSGLRPPKLSSHDFIRIIKKILKYFRGVHRITRDFYVFTPLLFPFNRYDAIRTLNKRILALELRFILFVLGFKDVILWIIIPHMEQMVGKLKEKSVVYYCVDDFSSLPDVDSEIIAEMDARLTRAADVIFTPSESLFKKKLLLNKKTYLSPHGVDIEHFNKIFSENLDLPYELIKLKKPIIGFFGLIEKWIDLDLLEYLVSKKPKFSFLMIGRVVQDISRFTKYENVHFIGAVKYELLPNYAKAFDVAIIPYVLNKQVANANPIKLREYLALGKPIVSVRNPEIERFSDLVYIADTYEKFAVNIELALLENNALLIEKRRQKVKDSSWENRFNIVSETVESILKKKDSEV